MITYEELCRMLGEQIKSERLADGMDRDKLAAKSGVSEQTIRKMENGEGGRFSSLYFVSLALGLPLNELLRRAEMGAL